MRRGRFRFEDPHCASWIARWSPIAERDKHAWHRSCHRDRHDSGANRTPARWMGHRWAAHECVDARMARVGTHVSPRSKIVLTTTFPSKPAGLILPCGPLEADRQRPAAPAVHCRNVLRLVAFARCRTHRARGGGNESRLRSTRSTANVKRAPRRRPAEAVIDECRRCEIDPLPLRSQRIGEPHLALAQAPAISESEQCCTCRDRQRSSPAVSLTTQCCDAKRPRCVSTADGTAEAPRPFCSATTPRRSMLKRDDANALSTRTLAATPARPQRGSLSPCSGPFGARMSSDRFAPAHNLYGLSSRCGRSAVRP